MLCVVGDSEVTTHIVPAGATIVLGRRGQSDVDIRIDDGSISRRHARLHNGAPPVIEDLGSTNGTRVDGRRLQPGERVELAVGATIKLGGVVVVIRRPDLPESAAGRSGPASAPAWSDVVVTSPKMKELYDLAARVARSEISVLIFGETGVGKEMLTEAIHRSSPRSNKPLLRLNCGAFSDSLLESELFGHEKGAFTGAVQAKTGLLESADGGTVFLDEIGEMPASLQVKLLRVIEERRITRVGGTRPRAIDVRLIAATHRDLEAEIKAGRFRQDLFFRLNGISFTVPPLRERKEEIESLANLFLAQFAKRAGRSSTPALSSEALAALNEYDWPGNVRELRNLIERALVLSSGHVITSAHLPLEKMAERRGSSPGWPEIELELEPPSAEPTLPPPALGNDAGGAVHGGSARTARGAAAEDECRRILEALNQCAGNQTHAARLLGISRTTLIARLDQYRLPRPRPRRAPGEPTP